MEIQNLELNGIKTRMAHLETADGKNNNGEQEKRK